MQIPLSWIKEFIHLSATPEEIAKMLTLVGVEVDGYEEAHLTWEGIVVGHVLEVEKHPNADKLCVAKVSDGKETYQVVCGAPNCRPGLKTAFAPLDASLTDENGKPFKIKRTKIRGVESFGMLCSGKELSVSEDDDGVLELTDGFETGRLLSDYYSDVIFDISLTPNLGHCASVRGVARELAAITGLPLHLPAVSLEETGEPIDQAIQASIFDSDACPRYACRLIKDVKVGPSPEWLSSRLEKCGLRPINNVVDATNYILMELGHPLHAFDYECLDGHRLIIKKAGTASVFQTLDGKERLLNEQDLMICDGSRPVAIAGVMGGMNSEVGERTRHVLLESAYFDPLAIRRTSKRLGLQTDASKRFERGTDPNGVIDVLNRAAELIKKVAGGQVSKGVIDDRLQEFPERMVSCRLDRANRLLGLALSRGEIEDLFQRLNFFSHWNGQNAFAVKIPTYRTDITSEIDLIEEIAKLYGYDNIPRKGGLYQASSLPHAPIYLFENETRTRLIAEGLQEFIACDLIGPTLLGIVQDETLDANSLIKVLNPTSIEQSILRISLLPGLLQAIKYNIDHQNHDISGFEIGRVHFKEGEQFNEQPVVGVVLTGKKHPLHWDAKPADYDFFDLKGIVENLLEQIGVRGATFKNLGLSVFHSGRQASLFVNGLEIGSIGEIHPAILRRLDVSQRILFGEFNLLDLMQVAKRKDTIKELAIYPGSERDWTLTIRQDVPFEKIVELIKADSSLLESVSLLDIYRNEKLGQNFQNITLRFVYRDPYKTVEQEVVDAEHRRLTTIVVEACAEAIKQ